MEYSANNHKKNDKGGTQQNSSITSQKSDGKFEAKIASILFLLSSLISNITEDDNLFVLSSLISLTAGILLLKAAHLEAEAQQIAPGVTTFANKLKIIGSSVSIIVTLILLWALLIEISLKQQGITFPQATAAGTTGAFSV
jgi:hypothetical protein